MEEEKEKVKLYNRDSLYEKFKNGKRPHEGDFEDLINSTINKLDDGIAKSFESGLELAPQGDEGSTVISLYEKLSDADASWLINLKGEEGNKDLYLENKEAENPALFLNRKNQIGINTNDPSCELEVNGVIGAKGRVGTYAQGEISANGEWMTILKGLEGVNAFELVAYAHDEKGKGKYALTRATLLNAYSGNRGRIKRTNDYYGWKWWHRIRLRWVGTPFDYSLEMKTASDYGDEGRINYHIATLL